MTSSVAYVFSRDAERAASRLPANLLRSCRVHALVLDAFASAVAGSLRIVEPIPVSRRDLVEFHSDEYVDLLLSAEDRISETSTDWLASLDEFGLLDDCPVFPGLSDYVRQVAGGTLAAVDALKDPQTTVAIYWDGGRHHAHNARASGFCYVNDIVLAILKLRETSLLDLRCQRHPFSGVDFNSRERTRVLYIDLDIHHGDAVQDAFAPPNRRVFCVSFHRAGPGFFPGTGTSSRDNEDTTEKNHLNMPLPPHTTSETFIKIVSSTVKQLAAEYLPHVLVVQCGLDGVRGDPLIGHTDAWWLDVFAIGECVRGIVQTARHHDAKVLLLGGGGYCNANAARGWTYATMCAIEETGGLLAGGGLGRGREFWMTAEIPDHEFSEEYAPLFMLYD
ncbi:Histone deacetylase 8 [Entophlyctis luteolus]|nr:Histone deacetylase 8 [Entophlyctis luteolus]